ncbi:MAG: TonB-dependent receptor [Chitinophagaceae bacterium]|nr:TonB-dependent receptor [Chitinophagaceae bacterium]
MFRYATYIFMLLIVLISTKARAQETKDSLLHTTANTVTIVEKRNTLLTNLPGSYTGIAAKEMKICAPLSGNEIFRRLGGIHVVDEEGAGLRLNLSLRGLDPDRSRNVLVLEDGVPVALNPYGEPELYYTPVIDRMEQVEVLKGSGQILFGPQTIGGVVNYITRMPPLKAGGTLKLIGGQRGFFTGRLGYGFTKGNVGVQFDYVHKRADHLGYTAFNIHDLSAKVMMTLSKRSTLGFKLGYYSEISDATYIGLTQSMFESGTQDFVKMAPDDRLKIKRINFSTHYQYAVNDHISFQTLAYHYTTDRNWRRQDFSSSPVANPTGVIWGDTNIAGGAIYMRNQNAHRNRQFAVSGIEPSLKFKYHLFKKEASLKTGIRLLHEKAYEQRLNGSQSDAASGALVEDEIRSGLALSGFAQQQMNINKRLIVHAGVRAEYYLYDRNILRNTFKIGNTNTIVDTNIHAGQTVTMLIPGIGFNYNLHADHTLFGGLHRGFAPPRVKDAVSTQGVVYPLDAEKSWNAEVGLRSKYGPYIQYELTAFYLLFSNQIIPVSESSGGIGSGLVNGGQTRHRGLEASLGIDVLKLLELKRSLIWKTNATWSNSVFDADRFMISGSDTLNIVDNNTPYAPNVRLNTSLILEWNANFGAQLSASYTGQQYSDALNTVSSTADGRNGLINAYTVLDAGVFATVPHTGLRLQLNVKNLTNERYIVSRRPQGIRLGLPRFISAGLEWSF